MKDNINPKHYRNQPVECIEYTQWLNFCVGNAFKYIWRYADKGGVEDLRKAEWCLQRQLFEMPQFTELDTDLHYNLAACFADLAFEPLQKKALVQLWEYAYSEHQHKLENALGLVQRMIEVCGAVEEAV